eukprot:CAMPEP_0119039248 /NCGR_PEP_ID=MMETSP1177-20130426/8648_1 /TAXON_ID=2985 /ORGANISM="Ochromonas sp, Strain CCMP1899" /LENGTH=672 /DNA_ID=CAMNT_0007002905 /DNA_START=134 /DNA_END=2152 /DNA_ORIENTATION=-
MAEFSNIDSQSPVSLREEIALKREEKRLGDISNCTFQPVFSPQKKTNSVGSVVSPDSSNRFDDLYNDARKRNVDRPRVNPVVSEVNTSKPSKSQLLAMDSLHKAAGAGRIILKEQAKELFQPKINKNKNSPNKSTTEDVSARLYSAADMHKANSERRLEEAAKKEKKECTFSPSILHKTQSMPDLSDASVDTINQGTVADRLALYGEKMRLKLEEEIKLKAINDLVGVTFQPTLSAKKSKINSDSVDQGTVVDRLSLYGEKMKIKLEEEIKLKAINDLIGSTFQPTLLAKQNTNNSDSLEDSPGGKDGDSRFDNLYQDAMKRRLDDPYARGLTEKDNTFKPEISPKAKAILGTRKPSDLVNSMHNATGSGRLKYSASAEDKNPYSPTITSMGTSINRSVDVAEHLYALEFIQQKKLETKQLEEVLKNLEACTFQPTLVAKGKKTPSDSDSDSVVNRLLKYGQEKKRNLEEEVLLRAQSDMAEVTFQPTNHAPYTCPLSNEEGEQWDRLYSDAIKRMTEDPLVRARVDESHLTYKPAISALAQSIDKSAFKEIRKEQMDLAMRKKEKELLRRESESTLAHKQWLSKPATSLDRPNMETTNGMMKDLSDLKKSKAAANMTEEDNIFKKYGVSSGSPVAKKISSLSTDACSTSDSSMSINSKDSPTRLEPQSIQL